MSTEEYITGLLLPYFKGEEPFSVSESTCLYNGPNGERCAFAKACIDPTQLVEGEPAEDNLLVLGFEILKEEARGAGLSAKEWDFVQSVHDSVGNSTNIIIRIWANIGLNSLSKYGQFTELRQAIAKYHKPQ